MNLWPSKFSPRSDTKRSPACSVLESVLTRERVASRFPAARLPPANSAICASVSVSIGRDAALRRPRIVLQCCNLKNDGRRSAASLPGHCHASCPKLQWMVLQCPARDLNVVERDRVIGEFLVGLVALAGDQDDVARLG